MSRHFDIIAAPIAGLRVLHRTPIGDSRGYLERLFCIHELESIMAGMAVVQINHTLTAKRATVRGMHFQYPPHAELKIVHCLRGEVYDIAVDIRRDSPTFLKWHGERLTAENHKAMVIPEGFAHGFQTLTDHCEMLYLHTAIYQADAEGGLNARDPDLAIRWPLPIGEQSPRDLAHPPIAAGFTGVAL